MAHSWFYWALASAFFAALTAIFAKAGLQGIDSDFATFDEEYTTLLVQMLRAGEIYRLATIFGLVTSQTLSQNILVTHHL